jgi:hypothetical protein
MKTGLIDKRFTVPVDVILDLEELAPLFGSHGRAIEIGTELLVSMRRKPKVKESQERVAAQTYSITPLTLDRIQHLLLGYENHGTVLRAVTRVLRERLLTTARLKPAR